MFIVDAHLDLAYNALRYGRDLRLELSEAREREKRVRDHPHGTITTTIPELLKSDVGLIFGTLFVLPARSNRQKNRKEPANVRLVYEDADQAYRAAGEQIDYYRRLADEVEQVRLVEDGESLEEVLASHEEGEEPLLGIVLLMEGADPVRAPEEVEEWYERGVRVIGPAWDDTLYAHGAWRGGGGFTEEGFALMEIMADLGMILDVTHLSEEATFEAADRYEGVVIASHSNARALVPGNRQLSDEQIRRLAERDGVMGVVMNNHFLKAGYRKSDAKESVTLDDVAAHVDHVCQLLGSADHVGIGSDMDGGFGRDDVPAEIDSIADLRKIGDVLQEKYAYDADHVAKIMGENWVERLRAAFA